MMLGLSAALVIGAACGDDDDDDADPTSPTGGATSPAGSDDEFDYASLSGTVRIDGSSTVFPISEAVAEEFSKVASGVRANVAFSGTGGGIEKFCRGEIEVADASRPMKDEEREEDCGGNDIDDVLEIQVAIDALTVMVHPDNDFAECLTTAEVYEIFREGGATNWKDVRSGFPDQAIETFYPGEDSGTFDYFVEAIIEGEGGDDALHTNDGTPSEDDNVLALGIENDAKAIGYFGFAYFLEAGDKLKAVEIDGGDGCVEPTFDAALDGSYTPLSRPLFIYTRESFLEEKPEVLGFINFYIENMQELVPDVGYVTLPEDLWQEQADKVAPYLD